MKGILYHYVVMRKIEVPDDCPSDDIGNTAEWCWNQGKDLIDYVVSEDTRDCEIVDVTNL